MDTVGKDIKKSMGEHYNLFLDDKEKLYYVPTMMGAITELPDRCAHIRYDEWKAIGSPEIKTPEDYYLSLIHILSGREFYRAFTTVYRRGIFAGWKNEKSKCGHALLHDFL